MLYALIPLHCPRAHAYIENCSKYALLFLNYVFLHRLTSSQNALRFIVYLVASLYCFKCLVRCDFPWIWFPVFISRMWCPVWALPMLPTSPLYYCSSSYQCGFPSFHLGRLSSSLHPHGLAWCLVLRVRRHKAKEYVSLESKTFVDGQIALTGCPVFLPRQRQSALSAGFLWSWGWAVRSRWFNTVLSLSACGPAFTWPSFYLTQIILKIFWNGLSTTSPLPCLPVYRC